MRSWQSVSELMQPPWSPLGVTKLPRGQKAQPARPRGKAASGQQPTGMGLQRCLWQALLPCLTRLHPEGCPEGTGCRWADVPVGKAAAGEASTGKTSLAQKAAGGLPALGKAAAGQTTAAGQGPATPKAMQLAVREASNKSAAALQAAGAAACAAAALRPQDAKPHLDWAKKTLH